MYYKHLKRIVKDLDCPEIYEYKHRGVPIWEVIKRRTIVSSFEKSEEVGKINHSDFSGGRLLITLYNVILSVLKIPLLFQNKDYLFLGFSRRVNVDNEYLDLYHDHLIESVGEEKCIMLERPVKGRHLKPRKFKYRVIYLDLMCYFSELVSRVLFLKASSAGFNDLKVHLESYGIQTPSLSVVNREINRFKVEELFAKFILSKIKPKSITITSKWLHLPFVMAANKKGIPVYEVQHGARFYYNLAYQGFGDFNKIRIDGFLTMGDAWNSFPWETRNVIPVGNSNFANVNKTESEVKGGLRSVLYISQPEIWETVVHDVAHLAARNPDYEITLRFHPKDIGDLEHRYGGLRDLPNIVFEFPDGNVSESILRHSLVVGYSSTVLFQSSDLGVPTSLMIGKGGSIEDYEDMFGDMIGSFLIIRNYDLDSVTKMPWHSAVEFFSPFKPDAWQTVIGGNGGE